MAGTVRGLCLKTVAVACVCLWRPQKDPQTNCCVWLLCLATAAVSCGMLGAAIARQVHRGRCGTVWSSFGLHSTAAGAPQTAAAAAAAGVGRTYAAMMCPRTLRPHAAGVIGALEGFGFQARAYSDLDTAPGSSSRACNCWQARGVPAIRLVLCELHMCDAAWQSRGGILRHPPSPPPGIVSWPPFLELPLKPRRMLWFPWWCRAVRWSQHDTPFPAAVCSARPPM